MKSRLSILLIVILLLTMILPASADAGSAPEIIHFSSEGDISADIGCITLTFNTAIDVDTLSGISFVKDDDGTDVKGGAYIVPGESSDKVDVRFGFIDNGTYTLSVTDSLKSTAGISAIPADYTYSVSDALSVYSKYRLDLTDVPTGTYTNEEIQELLSNSTFSAASRNEQSYGKYSVVSDESGNYISALFDNVPGSVGTSMAVELDTPIKTGDVRISYKLRAPTGSTLPVNTLIFKNTVSVGTLSLKNPTDLKKKDSGTCISALYNGKNSYTCALDDYGYMSLSFELSRQSESDSWNVTILDDYSEDRSIIAQGTISSADMPAIKNCQFFDTWGNSTYNGVTTDIKDIVIEIVPTQQLLYSDSLINPDADSMNVAFRYDEYSSSAPSMVRNSDGMEIESDIKLKDNRVFVIEPVDYLSYGETYTISFDNGICEDITIETTGHKLSMGDALIADNVITVPLTNTSLSPKNAIVFVAVMDSQGKITAIRTASVENFTGTGNARIDVSGLLGTKYSIYVWEDKGDYSVSVAEPVIMNQVIGGLEE